MTTILLLAGLLAIGSTVFAEEAVIQIAVKQRTQQKPIAVPFGSVGLFEIYRGETKFAPAACPDYSNKEGRLSCTITCSQKEQTRKNLRIIPPAKGLQIRGFVAPPADEIELVGCKVNPGLTREFVYIDSRLALNGIFKQDPSLAQFASDIGHGKTVTFPDANAVLQVYEKVAKSPDGLTKLSEIQRISALAAEANQADGDAAGAKQLNAYSVGVSNYFLKKIAVKNLGSESQTVKLTGETPDYYKNLWILEAGLEKQIGRTPEKNLLLNDVQRLKNSPYTLEDQETLKAYAKEALRVM